MKPFLDVLKQNKKAHRLNVMFSQSTVSFWFTTIMEDILGLVFFGFTDSVSSIFLEFDTVTILKKTKVKRKQIFSDMIHLTKNLTCYRDLVWKIAINIGQKLYKQSQFLKYCV